MDTVIEKLVYEDQKSKDRSDSSKNPHGAMNVRHQKKKGPRCFNCHKYGHVQRDCKSKPDRTRDQKPTPSTPQPRNNRNIKPSANPATTGRCSDSSASDDSEVGLILNHVLSVDSSRHLNGKWILDSGVTCHICSDRNMFDKLYPLKEKIDVKLGDGHTLKAVGEGTVLIHMKYGRHTRKCRLHGVLYIPNFAYNLVSVSKATKRGNSFKFNDAS